MRHALFIIIILALAASAQAKYSGGTGEPNTPYLISTAQDLNDIGNHIEDNTKYFLMTADINMSQYTGTQYKIIGPGSFIFGGTFDGNGHIIRNLTYTTTSNVEYAGMFGYTSHAVIKNLHLEDVNFSTGGYYAGGLIASQSYGEINNCSVTGFVASSFRTGGLVGTQSNAAIINSSCSGSITCSSPSASSYAGGLAGYQAGCSIYNCYSTGSVTSYGTVSSQAGGMVGLLNISSILSSYSTAAVAAYCSNNGANCETYAGGLIGLCDGNVTDCFSTGSVIASSQTSMITTSSAGGLLGYLGGTDTTIERCYSTGQVSAVGLWRYTGGLIGYIYHSDVIASCFWDIQSSGQAFGVGVGSSIGVTGKTTAQMKMLSTFVDANWDFNDVWAICEGTNYPKLKWQISAADFRCPDGVNFFDYSFFAERWLDTNCATNNDCDGTDFDTSGTVDIDDMKVFCDYWMEGI